MTLGIVSVNILLGMMNIADLQQGNQRIPDGKYLARMPCQQFQKIRSAPRMCW